MTSLSPIQLRFLSSLVFVLGSINLFAADATFYRALNLNGSALEIDGRKWDGTNAANFSVTGKFFENQSVALKSATGQARATSSN